MKSSFIYVWTSENAQDLSRWLQIFGSGEDHYVLGLSDLCHPGQLSSLKQVKVPSLVLHSLLAFGPIQMTDQDGYCLIRRNGDLLQIEFKGSADKQSCRVSVRAEDVANRLAILESTAASLTATA